MKPVPVGPNGWNGVSLTSEEMMKVPSIVWEVVTRRGGGRETIVQQGMRAYIRICACIRLECPLYQKVFRLHRIENR